MQYVPDSSGLFTNRPEYTQAEIDELAEIHIRGFMQSVEKPYSIPITNDDLTVFIEQYADYLNLYADLSCYGTGVEGVTEFYTDRRPIVLITSELSNRSYSHHRLRTTLAHELGHVLIHGPLFTVALTMIVQPRCQTHRSTTFSSTENTIKNKWMEWQAWQFARSLLMPQTNIYQHTSTFMERTGRTHYNQLIHGHKSDLIKSTAKWFDVSEQIALIRLQELGILSNSKL